MVLFSSFEDNLDCVYLVVFSEGDEGRGIKSWKYF